jgi:hypothetical protein
MYLDLGGVVCGMAEVALGRREASEGVIQDMPKS